MRTLTFLCLLVSGISSHAFESRLVMNPDSTYSRMDYSGVLIPVNQPANIFFSWSEMLKMERGLPAFRSDTTWGVEYFSLRQFPFFEDSKYVKTLRYQMNGVRIEFEQKEDSFREAIAVPFWVTIVLFAFGIWALGVADHYRSRLSLILTGVALVLGILSACILDGWSGFITATILSVTASIWNAYSWKNNGISGFFGGLFGGLVRAIACTGVLLVPRFDDASQPLLGLVLTLIVVLVWTVVIAANWKKLEDPEAHGLGFA